ncbi:MAG: hypothetical protein L6422_05845 [Candidatus Marinimicrobia bacterium]|nr:hypothetical protein [bacterium]MCG2715794.1 hypothetical protein [Candidatus Neomarinimicrobiota bacterium]
MNCEKNHVCKGVGIYLGALFFISLKTLRRCSPNRTIISWAVFVPFLSILDTFPTPEIGYKTLAIEYISLLKNCSQSHVFLDGKRNKKPGVYRAIHVE